jgi:acyl-CoA thioesterase-2
VWVVVEIRAIGDRGDGRIDDDPAHPARQRVWLRVKPTLPDDPVQQLAAFTYMSDLTLTGAALAPHGLRMGQGAFAASLDHAIWFHRPFRPDEWWLYDQVSPIATAGRAQVVANVFTQGGVLVATVVQEMLLRTTT